MGIHRFPLISIRNWRILKDIRRFMPSLQALQPRQRPVSILRQNLIARLEDQGVRFARIVLHVGLDTFAPVNEENPGTHRIHSEWCSLSREAADTINQAQKNNGRVIAVGTTSVRTLETAARSADSGHLVAPFSGNTDLFILPGFQFLAVDAMITNFHLPKSTLIMLVSAFAGREKILGAYQIAVQEKYRFYSFGDAMLIL